MNLCTSHPCLSTDAVPAWCAPCKPPKPQAACPERQTTQNPSSPTRATQTVKLTSPSSRPKPLEDDIQTVQHVDPTRKQTAHISLQWNINVKEHATPGNSSPKWRPRRAPPRRPASQCDPGQPCTRPAPRRTVELASRDRFGGAQELFAGRSTLTSRKPWCRPTTYPGGHATVEEP